MYMNTTMLSPLRPRSKKARSRRTVVKKAVEANHTVEFKVLSAMGNPIAFTLCEITLEDGRSLTQRTNEWGMIFIDQLPRPMTFSLRFVDAERANQDMAA
jgi:hypothetical protein